MPGNRLRSIVKNRRNAYEGMRKHGMAKSMAARIANAGKTHAQRSAMSKKGARTRKRRK